MIVTTAGHIDHGKTALVRALTGTDTDRLPEERARGITVDLGFAHLTTDAGTIGFVDVPGHERLVRTMVAGASGVDCALLVVAADDGVMPQTREHVAVLDLLGVRRAVVAVTKADRVDAARVTEVAGAVGALLAGTGMAGAPALPCNSLNGTGIAAIAAALQEVVEARAVVGRFRLAVDRSFTVAGAGLVVAGFVHAGSVQVGDRLVVSPAGHEVRVRGIQSHESVAMRGKAGERIALNLAGPRADQASIGRGAWLVDAALHRPTRRLDVQLRVLTSEARALKHWTAVHLHLGTASVMGRVALRGAVEPGAMTVGQLVLDADISGLCGDRFALRDASGQRTIGGGRVLDPFARGRGIAVGVEAWGLEDDEAALAALLENAPAGIDLAAFRQARNLAADERVTASCVVVGGMGVSHGGWARLQEEVLSGVRAHHAGQPDGWGPRVEEVIAGLGREMRGFGAAAVRAAVAAGLVARTGNLLHAPGREIRLGAADTVLWEEAHGAMAAAGLDPLRLGFLAERLGCAAEDLGGLLDRLARLGWVQRASGTYYLLPETVDALAMAAREAAGDGLLTVGRFRERAGIGRHATMPVLEMFDRLGVTRRVKDGRVIRGAAEGEPNGGISPAGP